MTFLEIEQERSRLSAKITSQLNKLLAMKLNWLFHKECSIVDLSKTPKPQFRWIQALVVNHWIHLPKHHFDNVQNHTIFCTNPSLGTALHCFLPKSPFMFIAVRPGIIRYEWWKLWITGYVGNLLHFREDQQSCLQM